MAIKLEFSNFNKMYEEYKVNRDTLYSSNFYIFNYS